MCSTSFVHLWPLTTSVCRFRDIIHENCNSLRSEFSGAVQGRYQNVRAVQRQWVIKMA